MNRHISPWPVGHQSGPRLVSVGEQASAIAAKILPSADPVIVQSALGMVELRPGTIWDGERMLVYASPNNVFYTVGDQLYECGTAGFVQDRWPNLKGRWSQDLPVVYLSHAEASLLQSLFVPWYMVLGMDAAAVGLFYSENRSALESALGESPYVLQMLIECRRRYTRLFDSLPVTTDAGLTMTALPFNLASENVALFIARAIRSSSPGKTLGAVRRIAITVIDIIKQLVVVLQGLFIFVLAAKAVGVILVAFGIPIGAYLLGINYDDLKEKAMKAYSVVLIERLSEEGYDLSEPEAKGILEELIWDPHAVMRLEDMETAVRRIIPVMEQLHAAYSCGH
jgi:hypothetical protein